MVLMVVSAKPAAAMPVGPAWAITVTGHPTNFEPESAFSVGEQRGPRYIISATNVGAGRTTGPFTVVDTLPPGVIPSPDREPSGYYGPSLQEGLPLTCSAVGQTVTCTGEERGVRPAEDVVVEIPVALSAGAASPAIDLVEVYGGGASQPARTSIRTMVEAEPSPFDLLPGAPGFRLAMINGDGTPATQAGAHPYSLTVGLGFPSIEAEPGFATMLSSGGGVRDIEVTLPPGVVVNPAATAKCKETEFEAKPNGCPPETQVGLVDVQLSATTGVGQFFRPLYNVVAPAGSPGEFGFEVIEGVFVHLIGHLSNDGEYRLSASANDIPAKVAVLGATTVLWGNPTAPSHDNLRGECLFESHGNEVTCPVERLNTAFVTLPSACSQSLGAAAKADSWLAPGAWISRTASNSDLAGNPTPVTGCSALGFEPSIRFRPDSNRTDSPTGLAVDLHLPQREDFEEGGSEEGGNPALATATLRDAKVALPTGFSVNPAAANGRGACRAEEVGLETPAGTAPRFSESPATCPPNSKVGSVEVETPLLVDEPQPGSQVKEVLPGSIYLAQPFENPFNSLLALYIVIDDPQTGIVVKIPGEVRADQTTGQLTATFLNNPQLPFEDFRLQFFRGQRAPLRTPGTCGSFPAVSDLSPWSGTGPVHSSEALTVTAAAGGGACPTTPQAQPNHPAFEAGTVSPLAGRYSPFVLHLDRADGSQEFEGINTRLPKGLTGKLTETPYCPDGALAAAASKSGREEQAAASCPSSSEIGRVTVGAGAGSQPLYVQGKAYLAGPYKGAPLSLAIITPAVAGPYDLGTVVVRAALHVDLLTAQISVQSDPLPRILQGIPLDVKSIAVEIGKPNFTLNPTSCEPSAVAGEALTTVSQIAPLSSRFQVGGCRELRFKPKLKLSLKGPTKRSGHPALRAVVTYPKQGLYANIARAQVGLPHSEFLDQGNLNKVCTQPELKTQTCPKTSIYGHAKAWTPLLAKPLEGPVYLGVGFGYKLPALVADLNGQIRVLLVGKVDTTKHKGLRNTFQAVPDAPVSRFVLEMKGGKKYGLLENSENICRKAQRASLNFVAQNGKRLHVLSKIANSCKKKHKSKQHKQHKHDQSKRHRT
jgi:hypothetical protein